MKEIRLSANDDLYRARRAAFMVAVVFGVYAILGWAATYVATLSTEKAGYCALIVLGAGLVLSAFLLVRSVLKGQGWTDGAVKTYLPEEPTEYTDVESLPDLPEHSALTPALPLAAENDSFRWNHGGVGEMVAKDLICGFNPRFMNWMVDYMLGKGNRWSEGTLENMPLPYEVGIFGKAEGNTPYQRLFGVPDGVFVKTGIVVGRGGVGNSTGKLAITDRVEIMRLLKALG